LDYIKSSIEGGALLRMKNKRIDYVILGRRIGMLQPLQDPSCGRQ
jgi:hypothetical protein